MPCGIGTATAGYRGGKGALEIESEAMCMQEGKGELIPHSSRPETRCREFVIVAVLHCKNSIYLLIII